MELYNITSEFSREIKKGPCCKFCINKNKTKLYILLILSKNVPVWIFLF